MNEVIQQRYCIAHTNSRPAPSVSYASHQYHPHETKRERERDVRSPSKPVPSIYSKSNIDLTPTLPPLIFFTSSIFSFLLLNART
jgi:hypothetical protein